MGGVFLASVDKGDEFTGQPVLYGSLLREVCGVASVERALSVHRFAINLWNIQCGDGCYNLV